MIGFPFAMLLSAGAVAAQPSPPRPPVRQDGCSNPHPTADVTQIVICAPKSQGYRLNPDVLEAKREVRSGGRPPRPGMGVMRDNSCATVGPAGCFNAGINLIGVALTAAEMASRIAQGKEIGSMFVTDPHPSEYQLYQMAKARREAREAEAAAKAKAASPKAP